MPQCPDKLSYTQSARRWNKNNYFTFLQLLLKITKRKVTTQHQTLRWESQQKPLHSASQPFTCTAPSVCLNVSKPNVSGVPSELTGKQHSRPWVTPLLLTIAATEEPRKWKTHLLKLQLQFLPPQRHGGINTDGLWLWQDKGNELSRKIILWLQWRHSSVSWGFFTKIAN